MSELLSTLACAKKIVIKLGSATLAKADGTINSQFLQDFALQCSSLIKQNKQLVLVSSGAQISGISTIASWARKKDVHYKQALASIGQVELMNQWRSAFFKYAIHIGQLLLTKDDFENDHRSLNIRNTLFTLVDEGVVPIINENDSVATDEFSIGDNDNLSALTAILWNADCLILFSDIDGIYSDNPKTKPEASFIPCVHDIAQLKSIITMGETNSFGTGGIATKLEAASKVLEFGIPMILANGEVESPLTSLVEGTARGTVFLPQAL